MEHRQPVEAHDTVVAVVLHTVYSHMVQVFASMREARLYVAAMARHFSLAEIYANGELVDSLHLTPQG